ncbi:hypothetical protein GCM10010430_80040 [Kitasatospora cystarginea]|uniref:Uncharacterized protein n=1 Tax=Kitasatospora cystarginea TaxID=58350 RepID=A0ABN3F1X0_9ACTN
MRGGARHAGGQPWYPGRAALSLSSIRDLGRCITDEEAERCALAAALPNRALAVIASHIPLPEPVAAPPSSKPSPAP